ncbi:hypothetical protein DPMN_118204 [Dreissena polymorpha]|uniref:Uncharacterized protein n=1 Tax=Dreissena polymorpha TaxID=45954 RepID=A0A9D4GH23_DREPO|nr:hypothetical protein DPMN_118203 [Dreissena polymorpha]KAH3816683.1 hypothetical protein DPMN_118204 [Dreissena polymorpha]
MVSRHLASAGKWQFVVETGLKRLGNTQNSHICEVTSFQTLVRSCLCTRLAETKKTVVCHLKVLVIGLHSVAVTEDLRGDQFPDIGSLLLVYEIGRD